MGSNEKVKMVAKDWLNGLASNLYDAGIQKLITRNNKCFILHGNYVKKLFRIFKSSNGLCFLDDLCFITISYMHNIKRLCSNCSI
jgi:hypothetical protein